MKNRAKITALCNQKGGVGKTVTAVNLGIGLAREGKRVLLADIDPQGSLTASLGYQRPDQMENTMAEILGRVISDEPQAPDEGIIHHAEGVDLLPANIELSGLEVTLVNTMSRETILRDYLNSVRDRYDVILLVNANLKMSIFAETKCNFSPVSTEVYTALIHQFTCRFEARQALIYQLVLGLTGENGKYNYSRAVHVYPLFFDITCSAKNYKIAPALTLAAQGDHRQGAV